MTGGALWERITKRGSKRTPKRSKGKSRASGKKRGSFRYAKKTYRGKGKGSYGHAGQRVRYTKQGRPYVIRKSGPMKGMARFIKRT